MRRAGISPWWSPKVVLQLAAIVWAGWSAVAAPAPAPSLGPAWLAGAALLLVGGACELWHYALLKRASPRVGDTAVLLTRGGLYGVVRHPMYLGDAIMVLGALGMARDSVALALALAFAAVLAPLVRDEDALLRKRFGEDFEAWAARTRRLLPGVW